MTSRPLYLLHGLMGTCAAHCGNQIRAWRSRYRILGLDLPGHGRSANDAVRPYFARGVELLHRHMQLSGRGHVLGVSYLGSTVAVRGALVYPELFQSLVITGYVPEVPQPVFCGWMDGFSALAARTPSLADHYEATHGPRWRTTLSVVSEECHADYANSVMLTRERFAALRVPTLIVNGALKSNERMAVAELAHLSPVLEGAIVPGAGHIVGDQQPEIFNLIVEKFWERTLGDVTVDASK